MATERPGKASGARRLLREYYESLLDHLGPQGWWPARTRLEMILGAILVQNTSWRNAALAVRQLRKAGLLRLDRLKKAAPQELEVSIRKAGFYRQKAAAIRNFLAGLEDCFQGSLAKLFACPPDQVRRDLLEIKGLGPETVDAILLYAGHQPIFVADAYTRRILARHGLVSAKAGYSEVQRFLQRHLPPDQALFSEFHALLVEIGKRFCRRQETHCEPCPLRRYLPQDGETPDLLSAPSVPVGEVS